MSSKNRKPIIIKEIEEEPSDLEKFVNKQLEENDGAIVHPHILSAEEIKYIMPSVTLKKVQVDTWLNVRNGPTPDSDIVGRVENGDIVEIFAAKDNFAKISETEDKWVNTKFLFPVH